MNTKTITQTGWVYFDLWRYGCGYPAAEHWKFIAGAKLDLGTSNIPVCEVTITFDVPADFDHRGPQIAALKAEKEKISAEFAERVTQIDRQINSLLAIECEVAA